MPEAPPSTPPSTPPGPLVGKRKKWMIPFFAGLAAITLLIFLWYVIWGRFYEFTDDSYVSGNSVIVSSRVDGTITAIYADETQLVEEGQLLISLDSTEYRLFYEQKRAEYANALRNAISLFENVSIAKNEVVWSDAQFMRAALDYDHRRAIVETGAVAEEEFEHTALDLQASFARLEESEYKLDSALAMVQGTTVLSHPTVLSAMDQMKYSYLNLTWTELRSPVRGIVGPRRAQVGGKIFSGSQLMTVIPLDEVWIYANFKETQLEKMRVGQSAKVKADIYGSYEFEGTVVGMAGGSGAVFSIIPPQNATGNWIKIVQRIPVRIELHPNDLARMPLRLGLSTEVTVDLHDTSGPYLPQATPQKPVYTTSIYSRELEGIGVIIEQTITDNVPPLFLEEDYYLKLFQGEEETENEPLSLPHEQRDL